MFVMSYFRTDCEALHLAWSGDGLKWMPLSINPILRADSKLKTMRDPHISRARDGVFHLFFTDGWGGDSIGHSTSTDLLHWSPQAIVPVMQGVGGTCNCWAPECFYDYEEDLYRIIWSSTVISPRMSTHVDEYGFDHRIWGTTTRDFTSYSPAQIFFDPGYNVIDASVARHDDRYLLAFKDERGENRQGTDYKAMRVCKSSRASGNWTEISELVSPSLTEGPALFRRDDEWIMIFDHFMEDFFGAATSRDGVQWTSISDQMQFPPGPRHASVFEVDAAITAGLRAAI